jgi:hypothetical protein
MLEPKFKTFNKFLKFILRGYIGICLFPFGIYLKDGWSGNIKTKNHESIHWQQQLELFFVGIIISILTVIGVNLLTIFSYINVAFTQFLLFMSLSAVFPFLLFYIFYVLEWLIKIPFYGKKTYMNLSYEREAYTNEANLNYIKSYRKPFASFKRLIH